MEIPWLEPFRAAEAHDVGRPLIVALATVDEAGDPQVRSVVCRRVDDDGALWIASDARSAKHWQLTRHPRAAAVAWFATTREQFRFTGLIEVLGPSSNSPARADLWRALSPETRGTFLWPDPGEPRTAPDDAFARASDAVGPPNSFEILLLRPTAVDRLVLTSHPHHRWLWTLAREWNVQELNP